MRDRSEKRAPIGSPSRHSSSPRTLLLRAGFNLRRKTLSNALRSAVEPDALRAAMEQAEISPTARAEELSVDDWIRLSNACP